MRDTRANKPRMNFLHYIALVSIASCRLVITELPHTLQICQQQFPSLLNVMDELPHLKPASKYVLYHVVLSHCIILYCRLSMEHLLNEVKEIKTNLKKMGEKLKGAPENVKQQIEEFLKVH